MMTTPTSDKNAPLDPTGDNSRPRRPYPHSTGDRSVMRDHGVEDRNYEGGVQREPNVDRPRDTGNPDR